MKALLNVFVFSFFHTIGFCQEGENLFNSTFPETTIEFSTKDVLWADSSSYRFALVTFKNVPTFQGNSIDGQIDFRPFYQYFNGPVYLYNSKCKIWALETTETAPDSMALGWKKEIKALFLISDFDQFDDSLSVVCEGHFGYINQSQMNTMFIRKKMHPKDILFVPYAFQSNASIETEVATNDWFEKYRKEHPDDDHFQSWYFDHRILNY